MTLALPLAHHNAVAALPVFVPALIVGLVVLVHYLRSRGEWDEEDGEVSAEGPGAGPEAAPADRPAPPPPPQPAAPE